MRISDWSSDVCSSDLPHQPPKDTQPPRHTIFAHQRIISHVPPHRLHHHSQQRHPHARCVHCAFLALPVLTLLWAAALQVFGLGTWRSEPGKVKDAVYSALANGYIHIGELSVHVCVFVRVLSCVCILRYSDCDISWR